MSVYARNKANPLASKEANLSQEVADVLQLALDSCKTAHSHSFVKNLHILDNGES